MHSDRFLVPEKEVLKTTRQMVAEGVDPRKVFTDTGKYRHLISLSREEILRELDEIIGEK